MTINYSLLSKSQLFKGLNTNDIEAIFSGLPYRIRKHPSGSLVCQSGEPVNSLMIIISGSVKGEMIDYAGKIIKIEDIEAPGALASAFLFGNINKFPVNVITMSETEFLVIEKSVFLNLLTVNNKILLNYLDMISNRSQFLSEKIKFLNFKSIKGKLAQYILKLGGDLKNEVQFDRTQNDMSDYFGVARPSIARVLKEMAEKGLIEVKGRRVLILDRKGLLDLTKD